MSVTNRIKSRITTLQSNNSFILEYIETNYLKMFPKYYFYFTFRIPQTKIIIMILFEIFKNIMNLVKCIFPG